VALPAEPRAGEDVIRAGIPEGLIEAPEELEQRVTPLELFFDLVLKQANGAELWAKIRLPV